MTRNLVLCFDGTNNEFGPENTNIVRLAQALDRDPLRQRLYYDPGVGTLPEPGTWSKLGKRLSEILGLAFGRGLTWKVQEAYVFLMDMWEPGDRVFVFGFSRGAYAARVLAGLLHALGLLPRGNPNLVPYVMKLFRAVSPHTMERAEGHKSRYEKICEEFRWSFSRQVTQGDEDRRFPVHFLGLWDTVSSVGWIWDPSSFPFTFKNPSVSVVRHAVSVDERRAFFRQNLMAKANGQDLCEQWFAGVHSDVGGGYPERDGGLWRVPFEWILKEACRSGLLLNHQRLTTVLTRSPVSSTPWDDQKHESLTPAWWLGEIFPKLRWCPALRVRLPHLNLWRPRQIPDGSRIDKSVLLRIRETNYAPPNFSSLFLENVRQLQEVPDAVNYKSGEL